MALADQLGHHEDRRRHGMLVNTVGTIAWKHVLGNIQWRHKWDVKWEFENKKQMLRDGKSRWCAGTYFYGEVVSDDAMVLPTPPSGKTFYATYRKEIEDQCENFYELRKIGAVASVVDLLEGSFDMTSTVEKHRAFRKHTEHTTEFLAAYDKAWGVVLKRSNISMSELFERDMQHESDKVFSRSAMAEAIRSGEMTPEMRQMVTDAAIKRSEALERGPRGNEAYADRAGHQPTSRNRGSSSSRDTYQAEQGPRTTRQVRDCPYTDARQKPPQRPPLHRPPGNHAAPGNWNANRNAVAGEWDDDQVPWRQWGGGGHHRGHTSEYSIDRGWTDEHERGGHYSSSSGQRHHDRRRNTGWW